MSHAFRSVRFQVTALATVVVVTLLVGASMLILRLVERDLVGEAEEVVNEAIGTLRDDLGVGIPEGAVLEFEFEGSRLFVGLVQEDDEIVGSLVDPETGNWIGELIVDPQTGELIEGFFEEGELAGEPIPEELEELVASAVRLDDGVFLIAGVPLEGVRDSIASLRRNLILIVPMLTVLLAGAVWLLVGRALRPVGAITEQARRITAETLHARVPEPAVADEIGDLARVVNDMLDRLEAAADRQRQFVSDASHELRTPMASIRAAAELSESVDQTRVRSLAREIEAEVDRMDDLVDGLLALARLDERGATPREPVDVRSIAELVALRFEGDVAISVEGLDPAMWSVDPGSLERLVVNLVSNAVQHTQSTVGVSLAADDGFFVVAVDDDGPGIPAADRERVFGRFVQLDQARSSDGFGLGLTIVRSIAAAHRGTVSVGDSALGGARFEVRLPSGA